VLVGLDHDGNVHSQTVDGDRVDGVRSERRGPVLTVTLDSPANRNALSAGLLDRLRTVLDSVAGDSDVRVVVLTGAGTTFSSGADLRERRLAHPMPDGPVGDGPAARGPAGDGPVGGGPAGDDRLAGVLSRIVELPQPVVCRVNGHVRGGGIGLVAASDLAVAPARATFAFSEVRVGVAPAVIAVPVLRVMGRRSFARYALTGEPFEAAEAVTAGLLTASVEAAALDGWVDGAVVSLLEGSPAALAVTKGLPERAAGEWERSLEEMAVVSSRLFGSAEGAEGMAAFLEKRRPRWAGGGSGSGAGR